MIDSEGRDCRLIIDASKAQLDVIRDGRSVRSINLRQIGIIVDGSTIKVLGRVFSRNSTSKASPTDAEIAAFGRLAKSFMDTTLEAPPSREPARVTDAPQRPPTSSSPHGLRPRRTVKARAVSSIAGVVKGAMWIILTLSVIGGLVLAFQSDERCSASSSDCIFTEKYPLLAYGLTVTVLGFVQCLTVIMIAAYIQARADGDID